MIAKPRAKEGEKAVAVAALLGGHGAEQFRCIWVVPLQSVGEFVVNSAVLFLEVNHKREELLL